MCDAAASCGIQKCLHAWELKEPNLICPHLCLQDVAVEPLNPHLFWSAAEDGAVRQFDTRVP
jgi:hypothetical protein